MLSPGRGPLIWGEDGDRPVKSPDQAVRSAREHPFAADAAVLADVHTGKPTTATVLLPSLRMCPLDSAELVRARLRSVPPRPPARLPWVVPALLVDPAELAEQSLQVRYGASVAHLRAVAAFDDDLVPRGRVPSWIPVPMRCPRGGWSSSSSPPAIGACR